MICSECCECVFSDEACDQIFCSTILAFPTAQIAVMLSCNEIRMGFSSSFSGTVQYNVTASVV
jgi:hypothetical protein